jgi:hypothetical protein
MYRLFLLILALFLFSFMFLDLFEIFIFSTVQSKILQIFVTIFLLLTFFYRKNHKEQ